MKSKKILLLCFMIILCSVLLLACTEGTTPGDTDAGSVSDTDGGDDVTVGTDGLASAVFEEGALYRICVNEEQTFEKGALTVQNFGMEDNSIVKLDIYGRHLSQIWRACKNDDGTYSFENMASGMYMSIRNPDNFKKEKKLSACLDGTNDIAKKWKVYSLDGTIEKCVIENVHSELFATAAKAVTANYAEQAKYEAKDTQTWNFKKVSDGKGEYPKMLVLSGDNQGSSSCPEILYHNGVYYNYNMTGPITLKTSEDMVHWTLHPDKYALSERPAWMTQVSGGTAIWAPGAYKIGDRFFLYYCTSSSGSRNSAIGVAVSDDPAKNDWQDLGMVIRSYNADTEIDGVMHKQSDFNAIDPNVFVDDDGTPYLIYGSYWTGVYMRKLDPATGKLADPEGAPVHLAQGNSDMEAPYLVKHGNYYYLFVARGGLKKGTYYWAVGRSEKLEGPYVDKDGQTMLSGNGGTRLTEWKEGIEGAAHAQCFTGPDGQSYMVSESWTFRDEDKNGPIQLTIGTIVWTEEGWPVTALDKNVLKALGE